MWKSGKCLMQGGSPSLVLCQVDIGAALEEQAPYCAPSVHAQRCITASE